MLTNKQRDNAVEVACDWLDELCSQTSATIMTGGPLDYDYDLDDAEDIHNVVLDIGMIARRAFEDIRSKLAEIETLRIEQEVEAAGAPADPHAEHRTYRAGAL